MRPLTGRQPHLAKPESVYAQEQLRERRRAGLTTVYGGGFSLADEVASICGPLAYRASGLPNPSVCAPRVDDLADATHELVSTVIGWLAEAEAWQRTEHLADDSGKRTAAIRLLVDLAQRPTLPEIGPDEISSERWVTALVDLAQPCTDPLSDLLARARPPDDPQLRGVASRSERLCDLLREVDTAARQLEIRIEKAEQAAAGQRRSRTKTDPLEELRALGIEVNA